MTRRLLLGYDIGSSSIKASMLDSETGALVASAVSPEQEMSMDVPQPGWAEQDPNIWWKHVVTATRALCTQASALSAFEIAAIGISYQMHGLVMVDKNGGLLRNAIIWCDSRAVGIGNEAAKVLGKPYCLTHLLNGPGNFTASKLSWVKTHEPEIFRKTYRVMLPGDFIAYKLTNYMATTVSGLSEGMFWDFHTDSVAASLMSNFGFENSHLAPLVPTFGEQGLLSAAAAVELGVKAGIPVTYRAGDQPNNAFSLNVLHPGEVATTAGTSGVVYGVTEKNLSDPEGRLNTFAHVNYSKATPNKGLLLCINGTGIQYSWLRHQVFDESISYETMNRLGAEVEPGARGLFCYPFGNGAERVLRNELVGGYFSNIEFNVHSRGHMVRAAQEGIACSFRYGFDVMKDLGMKSGVVRAGNSNLFQSSVFREALVSLCNVRLELYNTDGSQGAARGAGVGAKIFTSVREAFEGLTRLEEVIPKKELVERYETIFGGWKSGLQKILPA